MLSVVNNLDMREVTWAGSFCRAATEANMLVGPIADGSVNLYIGDTIDWESLDRHRQKHIYFLAAYEKTEVERRNIIEADATIVVSSPEYDSVLEDVEDEYASKVHVAGFPIQVKALRDRYAGEPGDSDLVAFIGSDNSAKQPLLEYEILLRLHDEGFRSVHMAPRVHSFREDFERAGCRVFEGLIGDSYMSIVAKAGYVACTSSYESLFSSGIEASATGCTPIVPDVNAGFRDWCIADMTYTANSIQSFMLKILERSANLGAETSIDQYEAKDFFVSVKECIE